MIVGTGARGQTPRIHKSRLGGVPLSQRLGEPRVGNWGTAWMGTRLADCPPVPPLRQPEQMSPYKHRVVCFAVAACPIDASHGIW